MFYGNISRVIICGIVPYSGTNPIIFPEHGIEYLAKPTVLVVINANEMHPIVG
jgi:hypothetical protein